VTQLEIIGFDRKNGKREKTMHESECRRHPIDIVSEDFLKRHRAGERPALEEYTARYPDLADEIRELFPLLLEMEQMRPSSGNSDRTNAGPFPAAPAAKQFGDYRIVREIGRGGMGIVYEAEQISLGRRVALKILPPQMLANPKHHRRFEREARAAAKLHHTNIVPVFGVGHKADEHYYVMQFIPGLGLDEVIRELQRMKIDGSESSGGPVDDSLEAAPQVDATAEQVARSLVTGRFEHTLAWDHESNDSSHTADSPGETPSPARSSSSESSQTGSSRNWTASSSHSLMPPGDGSSASGTRRQRQAYWHNVANVGRQVAEALHYAHEQGVLHRDIKPSNLLLDMGGTVWVTDFGLAKVADQQDLTHTGDILGTLRYLAPEALQGRADARSDLYSLGLTLYELTALRPAFDDTDPRRLIQQVSSGDPPRLDRLDPRIPRDLVTIVHKAIDRDTSHRYQTAEDMAADLVRFLNDEPIRARRLSSIERLARWSRRNRGLAASLGSMAILLVVGLIASVITAGHFRSLEKTQRDLANEKSALAASMSTLAGEKTELAERMTRLAEEKSELAAAMQQLADERTRIAVRAREAEKREADLRGEAEEEAEMRRRDVYFSDMFLGGHAASEQFSFFQTASLLDKWKPQPGLPDLRDWEWYYLDGQQHREARTFSFREKNDWVFDVGWSPDGKQVLAAGLTRDGSQPGRPLVVWDVASGQVATQILEDSLHRANVATWSPDGQYFAAGFYGYEFVHVYESSSGRLAKRFRTLGNNASDIDWTPDGARLVANGGNRVQVWDFHQECELLNLPAVKACSLSPSGEEIAVIHPDKVTVHSMSSGQVLRTLDDSPTGFSQPGASRGWSPDGTTLAVISSRNSVVLMDARSGELLGELSGHGASISTVDWSPDGTRLLTSGSDSTLRIWDRDTATSVAIIRGHGNVVLGGRWSPDGQHIASGSWDGTVRIWDVEKVLEPAVIPASRRRITRVRFHPTQHQVASSGNDGILRLWRPGAPEPTHQISGHAGRVPALAYSRDGNRLASAGSDGTVRLWRTQDGTPLATLRADEGLSDVDWDADGKRIAAVTHGGQIKIWDVDSGNELLSVRHTVNPDPYLAWDLKGRILFGGIWQPPQIMDPSTGTLLSTSLPQLGPTTAFRLNFDRSLYGVCHEHPVASVYKVAPTLEKVVELSAHPVGATTICFSPDGARVATGGTGGEVRVWDAATGAATLTIQAHQVAVRSIDWSPDGLRIVSAADDGTIAYHDASTGFHAQPIATGTAGVEQVGRGE
jgi:eukaryotic-like serine/threonine-protein kinase